MADSSHKKGIYFIRLSLILSSMLIELFRNVIARIAGIQCKLRSLYTTGL